MVEPWWGLSCLFGGWWNGTEVPLYVSLMMQGKFFIPNCKLPSRQIPTKKHQLPNPAVQLWPLWRTAVTRTRKSMVHRFGNVERSGKWGESWRVPSVFRVSARPSRGGTGFNVHNRLALGASGRRRAEGCSLWFFRGGKLATHLSREEEGGTLPLNGILN